MITNKNAINLGHNILPNISSNDLFKQYTQRGVQTAVNTFLNNDMIDNDVGSIIATEVVAKFLASGSWYQCKYEIKSSPSQQQLQKNGQYDVDSYIWVPNANGDVHRTCQIKHLHCDSKNLENKSEEHYKKANTQLLHANTTRGGGDCSLIFHRQESILSSFDEEIQDITRGIGNASTRGQPIPNVYMVYWSCSNEFDLHLGEWRLLTPHALFASYVEGICSGSNIYWRNQCQFLLEK